MSGVCIGSLETVSRESAKCKLDLVGVQEVRWDKGGPKPTDNYTFFYGNVNTDHRLGTGFIVHKGIISAVKRVDYVSDRMPYIIPIGRWCVLLF
jgi:hypothetical protein